MKKINKDLVFLYFLCIFFSLNIILHTYNKTDTNNFLFLSSAFIILIINIGLIIYELMNAGEL